MDELHNQPHKENPHLFKKGQSGNPAGRRKGARNKLDVLLETLKAGDLETIMGKAIELGKDGSVPAMRLVVNIILNAVRVEPASVDLPALQNAQDVLGAMQKVATEVASGELTANQGADLARVFNLFLHALGHLDLERRVRAVEQLSPAQAALASLPKFDA